MSAAKKGRFGALFCLLLLSFAAGAQPAYPNRAVKIVVAFSPGGVTDIIARSMAPKLAELWGQPVVVENRTGAGGSVGAMAVARSPADGYTLLVHSSGYALNTAINPALPYDPRKDFVEVAPLASQPMVLVVGASGPASVAELVAAARKAPGQVSYGSAGIGSGAHFNSEKFRIAAGIEVLHVPYKGGAEAIQDTIAGRIGFTFNTVTLALPHIREGRLRVLAVSSAQRSGLLPATPTVAESGIPGFEYTFWNGLWAPAGTPAPVVQKISLDLARVVTAPDVRERLATLGAEPMSMAPEEFARFVRAEIEDAARIARAAGIRLQ